MSIQSIGNEEVYHFLLHRHCERSYGCIHESSVNADEGFLRLKNVHLTRAVWMHAAMIEELTAQEQIYAFKELCHLRVIHHRHIELPVVRHRIGSLPVTERIANAYGHHIALYLVGVYFQMHPVFKPLEHEQYEGEEK